MDILKVMKSLRFDLERDNRLRGRGVAIKMQPFHALPQCLQLLLYHHSMRIALSEFVLKYL